MDRFDSISKIDVPEDHPISIFDRFWHAENAKADLVAWSTFDPMTMPAVLPWVLLLDCLPDDEYQYRLCGTGCENLLGVNLTGKKFGSIVKKRWAHKSKHEFTQIKEGKGPFYSKGKLPIDDREFIEMNRAVYGFSASGAGIDRIIAVVAPIDRKRLLSLA